MRLILTWGQMNTNIWWNMKLHFILKSFEVGTPGIISCKRKENKQVDLVCNFNSLPLSVSAQSQPSLHFHISKIGLPNIVPYKTLLVHSIRHCDVKVQKASFRHPMDEF
jgi:hypothetical protein